MNAAAPAQHFLLSLDQLAIGMAATVESIDGAMLGDQELRRLRHLGFDEGVQVQPLHLGPLGRDPIAIRVGRMTVAIRRRQARAIRVSLDQPAGR